MAGPSKWAHGMAMLLVLFLQLVSAAQTSHFLRNSGIKASYKEIDICETTPGVHSYSGYITVPNQESNIFFWFFESRSDPSSAPLTVWLQGGPGMASVNQAVSGHNGPCIVRNDSNSTVLNPWSWNGVSNMLYIDQPVQTGFSYDTATEGVMDMLTGAIDVSDTAPDANATTFPGRFASQDPRKTANTTEVAAEAIAGFLQLWFGEFEQYRRDSVSIWSQSYGGHFAPAIAAILNNQASRCKRGTAGGSSGLLVDSVGIINGYIDVVTQYTHNVEFAVNNTYGIQAYDESVATATSASLAEPGGCVDQVAGCQRLQLQYDPANRGTNQSVNEACLSAFVFCESAIDGPYMASGRDTFDIGRMMPDPFPPPYAVGFLQKEWVREALGAAVNFTETSTMVESGFVFTGDYFRGYSAELGALLDAGVKVALIYGDRDYQCNWFGGEALSLALNHSDKAAFASAGYADLQGASYGAAGKVRQQGRLSFTRVFDAGHQVPYYQPEVAYHLFARTLAGTDIATGLVPAGDAYATKGPASVRDVTNAPPPPLEPAIECYVEAAPLSARCTADQIQALQNGTAVVQAGIMISPRS